MMYRSIMLAALVAFVPTICLGSPVKITVNNGSVVVGEIVSLAGGVYTIRTPNGSVTLDASTVSEINTLSEDVGSQKANSGVSSSLRLAGSTTVGDELAPAIMEAYSTSVGAPNVTWTQEDPAELQLEGKGQGNEAFTAHLSRHGSSTAFKALLDGSADIGMASRRINDDEVAKLAAAGKGTFTDPGQENVLALDGLIIIVNKKNPISTLSITQMRDIFSGRITDWANVGGQPGPIHIFGRDSKSGTYDSFNSLVMGGNPFASSIIIADGNDDLSEKVQGDAAGIGYVGFAYLSGNKALNVTTECGITFPPSDLYVRTEEYPLSRRLYLYTPNTNSRPNVRKFIDFALGDSGQKLAAEKGFIDLVPKIADVSLGREAIALNYVQMTDDQSTNTVDYDLFTKYAHIATVANRLTTTFRFEKNSSNLDSRSMADIERLTEFLKAERPTSLVVAGFSDSKGQQRVNIKLSQDRADAVANLLRQRSIQPSIVQGFGRISPVSCNTTPEGQQKNRRVEVWIE